MISKKILFVATLLIPVSVKTTAAEELAILLNYVRTTLPMIMGQLSEPERVEAENLRLNIAGLKISNKTRTDFDEVLGGDASDKVCLVTFMFNSELPVAIRTLCLPANNKSDDENFASLLLVSSVGPFVIAQDVAKPPYSIKSDLWFLRTEGTKPIYLKLLLNFLTHMHSIYTSSSGETFCYDEDVRDKFKSLPATEFSILMRLNGGDFTMKMGDLTGCQTESSYDCKIKDKMKELNAKYLLVAQRQDDTTDAMKMAELDAIKREAASIVPKPLELTDSLVNEHIKDGRIKQLNIFFKPSGPKLSFYFPGFSPEQTSAFLNYIMTTFGMNIDG